MLRAMWPLVLNMLIFKGQENADIGLPARTLPPLERRIPDFGTWPPA
jgi:hypothetical protein